MKVYDLRKIQLTAAISGTVVLAVLISGALFYNRSAKREVLLTQIKDANKYIDKIQSLLDEKESIEQEYSATFLQEGQEDVQRDMLKIIEERLKKNSIKIVDIRKNVIDEDSVIIERIDAQIETGKESFIRFLYDSYASNDRFRISLFNLEPAEKKAGTLIGRIAVEQELVKKE